jgi:SAM-dependent methyltransferase
MQSADFWDGTADQYIASAEPFTSQFCEDAAILAAIKPGMTLLDVATGPGAAALAAARAGAKVTAIDFSPAMVDRLRARIGNLSITALQMDGQALDLPHAIFDRTVSVFGVPLFPDWRAGLREMLRVLKPGGHAVVAVANNPHGFGPNPLLATARKDVTGSDAPTEIEAWGILADPERLASEMKAAGFDSVILHERTHDFILDSAIFTSDHPMILNNPMLAGLADAERDVVIETAIADASRRAEHGILRLPGTARIAVCNKR